MPISTGSKLAAGGAFVAATGVPISIYAAKDHIFLYAVEREVIDKNLKFSVTGPTGTEKKINITIDSSDNEPKLSTGYSWSCEITVEPKTTGSTDNSSSLVSKLKASLFTSNGSITEAQKTNKNLLVRACAENREGTPSSSAVKGKLIAKEQQDKADVFSFENNPELNVLLETTSSGS